jgi:hypothetical protein
MNLSAWLAIVVDDLNSAHISGRPDLWRTEFKTVELEELIQEIKILPPPDLTWKPGDTPSPRPGHFEPARLCFVTCERKGLRFVTKAQYNFAQKRWFFDEPPSSPVKILAWMDAPEPYHPTSLTRATTD